MGKAIKVSDEVYDRLTQYEERNQKIISYGGYSWSQKRSKDATIKKLLDIVEELEKKEVKTKKKK